MHSYNTVDVTKVYKNRLVAAGDEGQGPGDREWALLVKSNVRLGLVLAVIEVFLSLLVVTWNHFSKSLPHSLLLTHMPWNEHM